MTQLLHGSGCQEAGINQAIQGKQRQVDVCSSTDFENQDEKTKDVGWEFMLSDEVRVFYLFFSQGSFFFLYLIDSLCIANVYNIIFGISYEMTTTNNQMHIFPYCNDTFLCLWIDENIKDLLVRYHFYYNLLLLSTAKYTQRKICQCYEII